MSTLQQVRDWVRRQTESETEDLPNETIDPFILEGFNRTFAAERQWPFFQYAWSFTLTAGNVKIAMPDDGNTVAGITRLRDADENYNLVRIDHVEALDKFQGATLDTGEPEWFSVWNSEIHFWPQPTTERHYTLYGYRKPNWNGLGTEQLDGDTRLHEAIAHFATALVYAQWEDPELEATYMQRWAQHRDAVQRDVMRPDPHESIILNGGVLPPSRGTEVWLNV